MDARLYQAALTGNVDSLIQLLEKDENILHLIQANDGIDETPLHTSALLGHVEFAREILGHKPQLASKPNANDSLPLHLAAEKGHIAIVQELLQVDAAGMCLARDRQGQTPLHVAAASGRVEVLKELLLANPAAMLAATLHGDSVFHVCAKHNHLEALKVLVESKDGANLVNMKDCEDNTVLHLAAAKKNVKMVEYLVLKNKDNIDVHAKNISGSMALDMVPERPRDKVYWKLRFILEGREWGKIQIDRCLNWWERREQVDGGWLEQSKGVLMLIATLIATVTYQSGLNPPGGFWQDMLLNNTAARLYANNDLLSAEKHHIAGEAIWSYVYPDEYKTFILFNSIGFLAAVLTILLLITGLPTQGKVLVRILTGIMWGAAATMVVTYSCSVYSVTSLNILPNSSWFLIDHIVIVWLLIVSLLFVGYFARFAIRLMQRFRYLPNKTSPHQLFREGEPSADTNLPNKTSPHQSFGQEEPSADVKLPMG